MDTMVSLRNLEEIVPHCYFVGFEIERNILG